MLNLSQNVFYKRFYNISGRIKLFPLTQGLRKYFCLCVSEFTTAMVTQRLQRTFLPRFIKVCAFSCMIIRISNKLPRRFRVNNFISSYRSMHRSIPYRKYTYQNYYKNLVGLFVCPSVYGSMKQILQISMKFFKNMAIIPCLLSI